jgi:predicted hydrocarbon binding protein
MSQSEASAEPRFEGSVAAAFPLALLESVRAHDHPGEVLEDEDLSVSLPRRLGLTGVVETQIMRYESAQRAGRSVPLGEVVNLIRLVMRRPDKEPILRETGQRIARWGYSRTPAVWAALLRRAPNVLGLRSARGAAVSALRSLKASDSISAAKPFTINVDDSITTRIEEGGTACTLFTGMLEEQLLLYTGRPHRVSHSDCLANGARHCEWTLVEHQPEAS